MTTMQTWTEKDYYVILGVSSGATQKQITHSYRKLAWKLHPDVNPGQSDADFKAIGEAYEVLGDPVRRKDYDAVRSAMTSDVRHDTTPDGAESGVGVSSFVSRYFGRTYRPVDRGDDVEVDVCVSHEDAEKGVLVHFDVKSNISCSTCTGSGAASGTVPIVCAKCSGTGKVMDDQGFFSLPTCCPDCKGMGSQIEKRCSACDGSGVVLTSRGMNWQLAPGVKDGDRYFYKKLGGAGRNGAPPGDLFVVVRVARRKIFSSKSAKSRG